MQTFNIGDIVSASYQYSSRHNHFFVVTKRTAHTMTVQRILARNVTDDGYGQNGTEEPALMSDNRTPAAKTADKPSTHRVKLDNFGNEKAKYQEYYSPFSKWDGKPLPFYTD